MVSSNAIKHIYVIRHGECRENRHNQIPKNDSSLSMKGVSQAYFVALGLLFKNIDVVVTSNFKRSKETGYILKKILKSSFISDSIFDERYINKSGSMLEYESVDQLFNRCVQGLEFLSSFEEENIVVVSHATWIKALLFLCEKRESTDFEKFNERYGLRNVAMLKGLISESGFKIESVTPPLFLKNINK